MIQIDRRSFLGAACSAAAAPLLTPVRLAAAEGENRLVTIILRGAMDALGVFAPLEDPNFRALRPTLGHGAPRGGYINLSDGFAVDGRLAPLVPMWRRGELAVAHAVSTPYRGKRSHFDGQDMLETGVGDVADIGDGWLNRALARIGGRELETAIAVGDRAMLLTQGAAPVRSWAPGASLTLKDDERRLLTRLYADDPLFANAAAMAADLSDLGADGGGAAGDPNIRVAAYAATRLSEEARIAAFSINGWDTHAGQRHALNRPLRALANALTSLRDGLGPAWERTLVVSMTEFGRTARENGNKGTDHGTGGAAILAGGALAKAAILGDWPGIAEGDLYEGRDLRPTMDVRRYPAWALHALFGLDRAALETAVFPGLDMGPAQRFIA
ncbi:MAG: DUF1501 domain-containing protein [Pseudomonadota bacterium]